MPVIDDITRINHIIEASEKVLKIIRGRKRHDLDQDDLLGLALVRLLEIVGEAAWGVSESLRSRYPKIPWRYMTGMRNRLIHGYLGIDNDTLWSIIRSDIPALLPSLRALKAEST